jgi:hypothetical protein
LPVAHPFLSDFISSVPESFTDTLNSLISKFSNDTSTKRADPNWNQMSSCTAANTANKSHDEVGQVFNNRLILVEFIKKFHEQAGTLTTQVRNSLRMLSDSDTKVFVSTHQPNLFAYGGIFKKIVLLQALKDSVLNAFDNGLKIINLFVVIDHDFMDENWIRVAQLPSIRHNSGIFEIRLPIDSHLRWLMVCNMPLPGRTTLDNWKKDLFSWLKKCSLFDPLLLSSLTPLTATSSPRLQTLSSSLSPNFSLSLSASDIKSSLIENMERFWQEVEKSYSRATGYSDFNAFLFSRIVNSEWGYDTLFARLTDLSPVFLRGYKYLVSNFGKYSDILSQTHDIFQRHRVSIGVSASSFLNAPLWLHCKCGSKAATKLNKNILYREADLLLEGKCIRCKKPLSINLGKKQDYEEREACAYFSLEDDIASKLSPRAIPIPLLLASELGMSCYASGTDGMRYIIFGSRLFEEFSVHERPLFVVWPAKDSYYGFAQQEALNMVDEKAQLDLSKYLELIKQRENSYRSIILSLIEDRNTRAKTGQPLDHILSRLFSLKVEQRKMRSLVKTAEKVKNVVDMRPSIIDYAVNFGLKNTELQWHQNLLRNDSLSATLGLFPPWQR